MPKLYRPYISLRIRVQVAERQLRDMDQVKGEIGIAGPRTSGNRLRTLLPWLARILGCDAADLRLDHDPALGARPRRGEGKRTVYTPAANDPDHLFYRPHGPEHAGSHLIKTNVRGDHGQHPDRVLIKKQRRLERAHSDAHSDAHKKRPRKAKFAQRTGASTKWPKRSFATRRKL